MPRGGKKKNKKKQERNRKNGRDNARQNNHVRSSTMTNSSQRSKPPIDDAPPKTQDMECEKQGNHSGPSATSSYRSSEGSMKHTMTQGKEYERQDNYGGQSTTTSFCLADGSSSTATEDAPPNLEAFQQRGNKVFPANYRTLYSRYKAATKRVFDYLQEYTHEKNCQDELMKVNYLVAAADSMAEADIPVDPEILKDLKFAIRTRSKVARTFYDGGDSGHQYLLDTLAYCWKVLDSLPRVVKENSASEKDEKLDDHQGGQETKNRFEALQETGELEEEDDDEDSSMEEEIFASQDVPRRPTVNVDSISLQKTEEWMDAWLFLLTLNDLMQYVAEFHSHVTQTADVIMEAGVCGSAIVPALLGATIASNMAIQRVQRLEIEFELQNPHINTPYRLLSTMFFGLHANDIVQVTREHGKRACTARDANLFLGDCLEYGFREKNDPEMKASEIRSDFCSRFEIDSKGSEAINEIFLDLRCAPVLEVPLSNEVEFTETLDHPSHDWFPSKGFKYIGGDRAIHHTIRLLQWFGMTAKQAPEGQLILPFEGSFGSSPWQPGKSKKIHNDLDELLMAEILPNWFWLCRDGVLNNDRILSRQSELAPLWSCIRRFFRAPEKPVKWSTAFAVHALLTAILETDKIAADLTLLCRDTFDSYFKQLDIACAHKKEVEGSADSSDFQTAMAALQYFQRLGRSCYGQRAIWNPLCGGSSLLYLNYMGNMVVGTRLIDDRSQLKIVLHLYHALVVNDIVQQEDIPFLDSLYRGFEKSRALWGGSLPRKGKFVEQFWMSMRGRLRVCEKIMAKVSRLDGTILSNQEHLAMIEMLCSNEAKAMTEHIYPFEFSTSSRRIFLRDFRDVVDSVHSKEIRQKGSGNESYAFAVQMNDTIEAFHKEKPLFACNLPACGVYLDEFVCYMSHFFEWDQLFKGALSEQNTHLEHPERIAEIYLFAYHLLGTLDQARDPSELGQIRSFVTFVMCPFFEKLVSKEKCIWL